ncbi:MAG: TIGR00266 family protein [Synergistales bacterium]|nr:TIGR00266 family protein [Synergistales bacterium]
MTQWYLSYDGRRLGPFEQGQAEAQVREKQNGYAWRQGFTEWKPISEVSELRGGEIPTHVPPPPGGGQADVIDYKILGSEMQFVEVELDPGESVVAEAGAMMYMEPDIHMEAIFGDGSAQSSGGGFLQSLVGAGKRVFTGESLFMTVFQHKGSGKGHVAFGAPYPGNVLPIPLPTVGGMLVCQKDSFLCAAKGVSIDLYLQRKILTGLFGGEGFIMQKLIGDGLVFVHAGGTVVERNLGPGETVKVDTGCVVAFDSGVNFEIHQAGNIKTSLFGGEGLFLAELTGPGTVWLQSLPFSRLAGRMLRAAPQKGGSKGEGSILGALGNIVDGDNN